MVILGSIEFKATWAKKRQKEKAGGMGQERKGILRKKKKRNN